MTVCANNKTKKYYYQTCFSNEINWKFPSWSKSSSEYCGETNLFLEKYQQHLNFLASSDNGDKTRYPSKSDVETNVIFCEGLEIQKKCRRWEPSKTWKYLQWKLMFQPIHFLGFVGQSISMSVKWTFRKKQWKLFQECENNFFRENKNSYYSCDETFLKNPYNYLKTYMNQQVERSTRHTRHHTVRKELTEFLANSEKRTQYLLLIWM